MSDKTDRVGVRNNSEVLTSDNILYNGQVATYIGVLMTENDDGDIAGVDDIYNLTHDDREVRDRAWVKEEDVVVIYEEVGVAMEVRRFLVETDPVDLTGNGNRLVVTYSTHLVTLPSHKDVLTVLLLTAHLVVAIVGGGKP